MRKILYLIIFTSLFSVFGIHSFAQNNLPKDLCISAKEYRLYELINEFRIANDMPAIGLSASMTQVAHLHVTDLNQNHPDTSICNLHSWSDKGDWTSCCYQAYVPNQNCMWDKPKELTPYKYRGYELAYFDPEGINPDSLMSFWLTIPQIQDMLLNRGTYKEKKWLAAGVGVQNGYTVVWFGQVKDPLRAPKICNKSTQTAVIKSNKKVQKLPKQKTNKAIVVDKKTDRYYLIFGSYDRPRDAEKQIKKYVKDGFTEAKIVINSEKIRISLSDHNSLVEAKAAKAKLSNKYKDAWIIKF